MGCIALWRCGFAFNVCKSKQKCLPQVEVAASSILAWKQINPINRKLLCPVCGYSRKNPGFCKQRCSFFIWKLGKISRSQYLGFVEEQTGRNKDTKLIILILLFPVRCHFRNNIEFISVSPTGTVIT